MIEEKEKQVTEQFSDILLVMDKEQKKIQAVKGIGKDGKLQTVPPTRENEKQFMRVDRHGDLFSNFFSNFLRQLKDPSKFKFFRSSAAKATDTAIDIQKHIDKPTKASAAKLDKIEVKQTDNINAENNKEMEKTKTTNDTGEYRYKPEQLDWETLSNLGLSKAKLEKLNLLDPLLKGYKTDVLVPVSLNLGSAITRLDARLSLQPGENGQAVIAIHGIRKEPQLNYPFFGHEFSKEDKANLLNNGNMGRVVDLKNPKTNEIIPSIISIDRLTNEVIALRTEYIKIPDEIKGVKLDEQQKQTLMDGMPLHLEGMISKKGVQFEATLQFNADKRYVEFQFDRSKNTAQTQTPSQANGDVPKVFRGKELDREQQDKLKAGETVYMDNLVDKSGNPYKGYVTFDKDTGMTDFSFKNPDKLKGQLQPSEDHKTQVAVNSEGKTNEATKSIKAPLKPKQNEPDSTKQKEQQEKPVKTRSRKI